MLQSFKKLKPFALIKKKGEKLKKNKRLLLIVVIGVCGMLLILLSEIFTSESDSNKTTDSSSESAVQSSEYKDKIRSELMSIIGKIDGVGEVDILVTVDGTTEYVYAEDLDKSSDEDDSKKSSDYSGKTVVIDEDGVQKPLIKKIIEPSVTGVLVVCSGGDRYEIIEKVERAVSTALNIPQSSVCVVKG